MQVGRNGLGFIYVPRSPEIVSLGSAAASSSSTLAKPMAQSPKGYGSLDSHTQRLSQEGCEVDLVRGVAHAVGRDDSGDPSSM